MCRSHLRPCAESIRQAFFQAHSHGFGPITGWHFPRTSACCHNSGASNKFSMTCGAVHSPVHAIHLSRQPSKSRLPSLPPRRAHGPLKQRRRLCFARLLHQSRRAGRPSLCLLNSSTQLLEQMHSRPTMSALDSLSSHSELISLSAAVGCWAPSLHAYRS